MKRMMSVLVGGLVTLALPSSASAAGDAEKGKAAFKECAACHTVEAGKNKIGPSLFGVVGAKAGAVEGFRYSKPLLEKAEGGLTWTPENLIAFLKAPKELIPAGSMAYAGLSKSKAYQDDPDAAADVVAYLATLK